VRWTLDQSDSELLIDYSLAKGAVHAKTRRGYQARD
jgi:hypothetical protein